MKFVNNPDLVINVEPDMVNPLPMIRYRNTDEGYKGRIIPMPATENDYADCSFGTEYGKLAAKDIFKKIEEGEEEKYIDSADGIKRVKSYVNGSEIINTITRGKIDIAGYISVEGKRYISLKISRYSENVTVTPYYPLEIFDSNEDVEKIFVRYLEICDTRAFKKSFLSSLRNLIFEKLRSQTPHKIYNLGWEENDGIYVFETYESVGDSNLSMILSNHMMPLMKDVTLEQIYVRLKMLVEENKFCLPEFSYLFGIGVCSNYLSLFGACYRKIPVVHLIGNLQKNEVVITELLSYFEKNGTAWVYNIQDYNQETIKKLFLTTMDDFIAIDISDMRRKQDLVKLLNIGRNVGNIKLRTPIAFLQSNNEDPLIEGIYVNTDYISIEGIDGFAIKSLKKFLLDSYEKNFSMIKDIQEWQKENRASPIDATLKLMYEYSKGILGEQLGSVLVKLFCNTLFDKYLSVTSLHWC